jgi:hypothetical protein
VSKEKKKKTVCPTPRLPILLQKRIIIIIIIISISLSLSLSLCLQEEPAAEESVS